MSALLNSIQARAVKAAIDSEAEQFFMVWETAQVTRVGDLIAVQRVPARKGDTVETHVGTDNFINAYTFLL